MSDTPRTDAARKATYTPEYEYEGAEHVAWEWAEKLERELDALKRSIGHSQRIEYVVDALPIIK